MASHPQYVQLNSSNASLVVDCTKNTPAILYWGKRLSDSTNTTMLSLLATRQEAKCAVVTEAPISLSPTMGEGFTGSPGIEVTNESIAWSVAGKLISVEQMSDTFAVFTTKDDIRNITIVHKLALDHDSNVLSATTELTNRSEHPLNVGYCAAPTLPLPDFITKILSFEGRWSSEFNTSTIDLFLGSYLRENRKGKTSHDNFPGVVLHAEHATEQQGECYGFHLGWSGNHRIKAELLPEQRTYVQMGELLMPSELTLAPNESYLSPTLYASYSCEGFSALSNGFHQFVRQHLLSSKITTTPRPVHYNTWEGIYFDHDVQTLKNLADQVAELGVERFVMDDGWFKGRRGDNAGLGDWTVDKHIYPVGLSPIIDYVTNKGMAFGIWFEPEMVNPDSDLYRAHPDWVLQTEGNEQLSFRNQLVLDFTQTAVTDYLFNAISDILTEYPSITYIKWDHNRDINHAGNLLGQPAIRLQTLALYKLIDDLKIKHPNVDIESCSSGGARIDYGVLARTDRVWTSDSNDAIDRLSIQRGCSFFFPAEIMGAHVGPRDCHITGRHINIEMRAAVSFFGHMGIEMDPRELTEHETQSLKDIIALHKKHRQLIHTGNLVRIAQDGKSIDFGIVNQDKTQALFSYNSVIESRRTMPAKFRFYGLDASKQYTFNMIWPTQLEEYRPSILAKLNGKVVSGEALMQFGMQLPITFPQTSLIFELIEA